MDNEYTDIHEDSAGLILTEYQRQNDVHLQVADWLDRKAFGLLGLSSIMVAFAMMLGGLPQLVLTGMALYAVIVATCFVVVFPKSYELPVTIDRDELCELYLLKEPRLVSVQLLSQYIKVIESNKVVISNKSRWFGYELFLFVGFVVVFLFTVYLGFNG